MYLLCITLLLVYKASLHKVVPLSTIEAKYIVVKKTLKETLYLKGLVEELRMQ